MADAAQATTAQIPAVSKGRGRPRKYTKEEQKQKRSEYMKKYYEQHKEQMYNSQKQWRERKKTTTATITS